MPIRGIGIDDIPPVGGFRVRKHAYTLATYTAAGTRVPTAGDIVSFSTGANDRVVMCPDNTTNGFGRVLRVDVADLTVDVEWVDVYAFVKLPIANLANVTLGNSLIKNGNTTVVADFDGLAALGNLIAISLSGTTGAGFACAALIITGKGI